MSLGRVHNDLPPTNSKAVKKFSIKDNRDKLLEKDSIIPSKLSARHQRLEMGFLHPEHFEEDGRRD